jgi:SAM-dependent methyltransferase
MTHIAHPPTVQFDREYAAEQLRRSHHPLRRFVKGFYLRHILHDVLGPSIDFGCGAGQLLKCLPAGSVGLEVNPHLIDALRSAGLTVHQAQAVIEDFELKSFTSGSFRTLVIAHVLEHLPDPVAALRVLLAACRRLGIERVIVVVPGAKGYASDRTHKTFIDRTYLESRMPPTCEGFVRSSLSYFPGPWEWVGRHFIFHEMKVVFDRLAEPD